jgi:hypothetical protein
MSIGTRIDSGPAKQFTRQSDAVPSLWRERSCFCVTFQLALFKYVEGQFTPLSKPFKTKAAAEKARLKLPERERRQVGIGVVRTSG